MIGVITLLCWPSIADNWHDCVASRASPAKTYTSTHNKHTDESVQKRDFEDSSNTSFFMMN